jgi:hypothetical protein
MGGNGSVNRIWLIAKRRRAFGMLALAAAQVMAARAGAAEITSDWSGNTGNWTDGTQWSTNPNYPNNETPASVEYDAEITAPGAGAYTVSLASTVTTDSLTLGSPNATLLQTGGTLTTAAVNISAGTYFLSGGSLEAASYTNSGGTLAVAMGSALTLSSFESADNTGGTIAAETNGFVQLNFSGTVTTAQLGNMVNNGGAFFINGLGADIDNTGQTLTFQGSGGGTTLYNVAVTGGVLSMPAGGAMGRSYLYGVTLGSDLQLTDQNLLVQNLNGGGHTINMANNDVAELFVAGGTSATLSNVVVNMDDYHEGSMLTSYRGIPLTIDSNTTVEGSGSVGSGLVSDSTVLTNLGTITANLAGQTLSVEPRGSFVNKGTLSAVNGGTLSIVTLGNFGGTFSVDDQSCITGSLLSLASGAAFDVQLGNLGQCGMLSGPVGIATNTTLNLSMAPGAVFSGPYEIAYSPDGVFGTFSQVTPGYVVSYSTPDEILVTAVPEPASGGLLFGLGGAMLLRRRARSPSG